MPTTIKPALEIDAPELVDLFGIKPVPSEELVPRDKVGRTLLSIMAHRPKMWRARMAMIKALEEEGTLPPRLIELIRIRLTFWTQCRSCAAVRFLPEDQIPEDLVCSLERPADAPDLTEAERVVMRFVDLYASDNTAITETLYDELREHFSEAELVEIGAWCAEFYGWGRFVQTFHTWDDLPAELREPDEGEQISAWLGFEPLRGRAHSATK
jgi:alkylhydroperoxidase family enzyme